MDPDPTPPGYTTTPGGTLTPRDDRATAHAIDRAHRAFTCALAALAASLTAIVMSAIALAD